MPFRGGGLTLILIHPGIWPTYPEIKQAGIEPLTHYVLLGERDGRRPTPIFDPVWYRERYSLSETDLVFAHYLAHRTTGRVSPIPEFDAEYYYRTYPDIAAAAIDPFEHYINAGFREGRNPSPEFDTALLHQAVSRRLNRRMPAVPFHRAQA